MGRFDPGQPALEAERGADINRLAVAPFVFEWLEASETSLVGEWLGLLKVEPLEVLVYASVGALSLALLSPVGWLLSALLG